MRVPAPCARIEPLRLLSALESSPASTPDRAPSPWRRFAPVLLLFLLPLAVRAAALGHGGQRGYVPDTHIVRSALGMARDMNPVPPVGKYSVYPNLLPYCLLPLYATDFVFGRMSGRWDGKEGYKAHLQLHPAEAHHIARWLILLLGSLTPLVLFHGARAAGLGPGAWVTGALAASCLLLLQFCTQERPWAPLTTFIAFAAWGSIAHVRSGSLRPLFLCGVAAGLAFATHQAGLMALGLAGLAWLMGPLHWRGSRALGARLKVGVLCVVLFALVAVIIGHPYWLVHGPTASQAVVGGAAQNEAQGAWTIGGMTLVPTLRLQSFAPLFRALVGYDPLLLFMGLAGLPLAFACRALGPVLLWILLTGALFLTAQSDHVRYLLPTLVLLALPAGFLGERLSARPLGVLLLALLLLLPLVQGLRFVTLLRRADTRAQAELQLAQLAPGALVAIDRYGPIVELSRDALERLARMRAAAGGELYGRERFRLELLELGAFLEPDLGRDALRLEDCFDFNERERSVAVREGLREWAATPRALLDEFGVTHLLAVRRRGDSEPHLLASELKGLALLWSIDPSSGEGGGETFLPLEMEFPLTALWTVERPGPRLDLYALP